jgi:hypothetical protein
VDPETRKIALHMREFGLGIMAHAIRNATFSEYGNAYAHALSVTVAAQAAEILIKARIAEEHPLLIFTALPKPTSHTETLDLGALLLSGRTAQYGDLPDLLWAATGYHIPERQEYENFGKLRNQLQHLAIPDENLSDRTLRFVFQVVAPMAKEFWGENVIRHVDADDIEYVEERVRELGLPFDEVLD